MKKQQKEKAEQAKKELFIPGVFLSPILSEKVTNLGLRAFKVAKNATKKTVKEAAQRNLGLKVASVKIINVKSKPKRFKGIPGKRSSYKKALIKIT